MLVPLPIPPVNPPAWVSRLVSVSPALVPDPAPEVPVPGSRWPWMPYSVECSMPGLVGEMEEP